MFFSTNKSQLLQFFVIFHRSTKKFLLPHGAKNIVLIVVNIRKLYTFAIGGYNIPTRFCLSKT